VELIGVHTDAAKVPQEYCYVSLAGYRFLDLVEVYRRYHIKSLYSLEANPQTCKRAEFNKPYEWVTVFSGTLPDFIARNGPVLRTKKKILFLDYDSPLGTDVVQELDALFVSDFFEANGLLYLTLNSMLGSPTPYVREAAKRERFLRGEDFEIWLKSHVANLVRSKLRARFRDKDLRQLGAFAYRDTSPMCVFAFRIDETKAFVEPYSEREFERILVPDVTPIEQHTLRRQSSKGVAHLESLTGIEKADIEFFLAHD
jgi:hypothetical protein